MSRKWCRHRKEWRDEIWATKSKSDWMPVDCWRVARFERFQRGAGQSDAGRGFSQPESEHEFAGGYEQGGSLPAGRAGRDYSGDSFQLSPQASKYPAQTESSGQTDARARQAAE